MPDLPEHQPSTAQTATGANGATPAWLAITVFTAVSVAANAAHVLAPRFIAGAQWNGWTVQGLEGAAICALMPVALFFATHTIVGIITRIGARPKEPVRSVPPISGEPNSPVRVAAEPVLLMLAKPTAGNVVPLRTAVDEGEALALSARRFSYARIAEGIGTNKARVGRIVRAAGPEGVRQG